MLDEVAAWQQRPLDAVYPLVFFDAIRVKIRDEGMVRNKAIHIALGVRADGGKEVLGLWLEQNEGAKFWLRVMNELKNRGVEDILLAVVDGLKGFPDAITAVFPDATVQTCIVHLLRNSMDFVSWKDRKGLATALKDIYRAVDADAAEKALTAFEAGPWGQRYPAIGQSWRRAWGEVIPFFAFPDEVRRIVYTTNAIEALNSKLRRAVRARGHFPSDDAATKLLYLILNRSEKEWRMPPREWSMAKAQFAVMFGERFIKAMGVTFIPLPHCHNRLGASFSKRWPGFGGALSLGLTRPFRHRIWCTVDGAGTASPCRFKQCAILRAPQAGCWSRIASTCASVPASLRRGMTCGRRDRSANSRSPAVQRVSHL